MLTEASPWVHTFLLGWAVTVTSGVCAYPLDSVKRRMMMTAGEEVRPSFSSSPSSSSCPSPSSRTSLSPPSSSQVRYASSMACFKEIVAREGYRALFRGAGVNIVRGVAGAGVLTSFDRAKAFYISRKQLM